MYQEKSIAFIMEYNFDKTNEEIHNKHLWMRSICHKQEGQEDLGRSPEEKVKGHSGAVYRGLEVHNLNNFGRGTLDNVLYQIWKLWAF